MELSRYRQHLGLSALPSPNEDTPLVLPIGATASNERTKTCAPLTRASLHAIVKDIFAGAAARLRERDDTASARADLLEKASAHWLKRWSAAAMRKPAGNSSQSPSARRHDSGTIAYSKHPTRSSPPRIASKSKAECRDAAETFEMHTDLAQKRESMDEYEAAPILYVRDYECLFEQGRVRMC